MSEDSKSEPNPGQERIDDDLNDIIDKDRNIQTWMERQPLRRDAVLAEAQKILSTSRFDFANKLNHLERIQGDIAEDHVDKKQSQVIKLGGILLACGAAGLLLLLVVSAIKWTGHLPKIPLWPLVVVLVVLIVLGLWLLTSGVRSHSRKIQSSDRSRSEELLLDSALRDQLRSLVLIPALERLSPPDFKSLSSDRVLITDAPHLSHRLETTGQIETASYRAILTNLGRSGGATIGLAGTRGVGKSELLRTFCTETKRQASTEDETGYVIGVLIPAPVVYDLGSFLRMVIIRLAEAVPGYDDAARSFDRQTREPSPLDIAGLLLCGLLFVGGVGLLTGLTNTDRDVLAWVLIVVGAALSVVVLLFRFLLPPWFGPGGAERIAGAMELAIGGVAQDSDHSRVSNFIFHVFRSIFAKNWKTETQKIDTQEAETRDPMTQEQLEVLRVAQLKQRLRREPLAKDAVSLARTIRYVETQSRSTEASATFKGAGVKAMSGRSLEQIPLTEADLVLELTRFVKHLNESGYQVRIGIDELDKLETSDDTEKFLTGIKILFPIRNCSFLLTISENTAAQFENSLDRVIVVQPLSFAEARRMVRSRFPLGQSEKMSDTQILYCYCLSGGLPRNLLRYCQQLGELNSRAEEEDRYLDRVLAEMLKLELRAQLDKIRFSLTMDDGHAGDILAVELEQIEERFVADMTGGLLTRFLDSDCSFQSLCLGRVDDMANAQDHGDSEDDRVRVARRQVYSHLLFVETVRQAFGDCRPITSFKTDEVERVFELLCDARRRLETDTAAGWRRTVKAREQLGLQPLPV